MDRKHNGLDGDPLRTKQEKAGPGEKAVEETGTPGWGGGQERLQGGSSADMVCGWESERDGGRGGDWGWRE